MTDLTDNHLYKKENCPKCGTFITIYSDLVGLLPDETIDGELHTHSSLVCTLRKEIKELKDKYKSV